MCPEVMSGRCDRLWLPLMLALMLPFAASATEGEVRVSEDPEREIHVEARDASRSRVLEQLQAKTGVLIANRLSANPRVSVSCHERSIGAVLGCVLGRDADFMIETEADTHTTRVSILDARGDIGLSSSPKATGIRSNDQAENRLGADPAEGPGEEPGVAPDDLSQANEAILIAQATAGDADHRARALGKLIAKGDVDQEALLPMLKAAMTDPDPRVRAQAVHGLAASTDGDSGEPLPTALKDPDPSVRLMAVDSVRMNDAGIDLLKQAAHDSDATIREYAQRRLAVMK